MEQVIKLLKGRKAAAKLEIESSRLQVSKLYVEARQKRYDEIKQIDKALLLLSDVVGQSEQLKAFAEWHAKEPFTNEEHQDLSKRVDRYLSL